jgi:hypothetical protein
LRRGRRPNTRHQRPAASTTNREDGRRAEGPAPLARGCGGHGPSGMGSPAATQRVGGAAVASVGGPRVAGCGCAVCGPRLPAFGASAGLLVLGLAVLAALVRPRGGHPRCTKSPPLCTIQNHSIKVAQSLEWRAASFLEHHIRTETTEPPTVTVGNFGVMMIKTLGQQRLEASPLQMLLVCFFSRGDGQIGSLRALVVELTPSIPPCSVRLLFSLPCGLFTVRLWRWRPINRNPLRLGNVWGCCRQAAQHVGVFTFVKLPMFGLAKRTSARSSAC